MSIEDDAPTVAPRADLVSACLWMVIGTAIAVGSWQMDRLENLNINRYEIPGLVPGLLGAVLALLGVVLAWRAVGQGALTTAGRETPTAAAEAAIRWPVLLMAVAYALLLVGRGMPFWLATALFVTAFIAVFDAQRQQSLGRGLAQRLVHAAVMGLATSATVSFVFSELFLVRLP